VGEFGKVRDGGTSPHQGIDILGTSHTLALSADQGTVTFVGEAGGYGLMVEIGHANAEGKIVSYTAYAHLASASVKQGQVVTAGQDIGVVGRSGNVPSDAPTQLHFEIRTQSMPRKGSGLGGRLDPLEQFPQLIKVP
jgi:murein DD-endopeptidase MepM/ murein hydrolase activator NlpD